MADERGHEVVQVVVQQADESQAGRQRCKALERLECGDGAQCLAMGRGAVMWSRRIRSVHACHRSCGRGVLSPCFYRLGLLVRGALGAGRARSAFVCSSQSSASICAMNRRR